MEADGTLFLDIVVKLIKLETEQQPLTMSPAIVSVASSIIALF